MDKAKELQLAVRLDHLEQTISYLEDRLARLESQVSEGDKTVGDVAGRVDDLENGQEKWERELEALQEQIKEEERAREDGLAGKVDRPELAELAEAVDRAWGKLERLEDDHAALRHRVLS